MLKQKLSVEKLGLYSPTGKYQIRVDPKSDKNSVYLQLVDRNNGDNVLVRHGFGANFVHEVAWIEGKENSDDYVYFACKAGMSFLHNLTQGGRDIEHTLSEIRSMEFTHGPTEDPRGTKTDGPLSVYFSGFLSCGGTLKFNPEFSSKETMLNRLEDKTFIESLHGMAVEEYKSSFNTPAIYNMCCASVQKVIIQLTNDRSLCFTYENGLKNGYKSYEVILQENT